MKLKLLSLFALLSLAGCSGKALSLKKDPAPLALQAQDLTAPISAQCGGRQTQVTEGYAYCRLPEGPLLDTSGVTLLAPPEAKNCGNEPFCVDFTIFYPESMIAVQVAIEKGKDARFISWKEILKKDRLEATDRGFWPFVTTIRWLDASGKLRKTVLEGEIRLRVYRNVVCDDSGQNCASYEPLREAESDENFAWTWIYQAQKIKMTTSGRVYVSEPVFGPQEAGSFRFQSLTSSVK